MELVRTIVKYLTIGSLALAALQIYLTVNKIWKRKHERVVAESISIMGEFIGVVPLLVLSTNFALEGQWAGMVDALMWILAGAVLMTIGTGLWVEGQRRKGFWTLVQEAIRLERGEVGDLAKSLFRPSAADKVIRILGQVALIDEHLDEREREYIESFADSWGIDFSWDELAGARGEGHLNFLELRRDVADYLATSPPEGQVRGLSDVLSSLAGLDEQVTEEEQLVLNELDGMFNSYLDRDFEAPLYAIAIVPQDPEQDRAIASLLPGVEKRKVQGGHAYLTGTYHSERYAELAGEDYRALNFFTTVIRRN